MTSGLAMEAGGWTAFRPETCTHQACGQAAEGSAGGEAGAGDAVLAML